MLCLAMHESNLTFSIFRSIQEDKIDLIRLDPVLVDYENVCGNKLDFQIIPKGPEESVDILITGENVKMDDYHNGITTKILYIYIYIYISF